MNRRPASETLAEASARTGRMWKRNLLWTLLVFTAALAWLFLRPAGIRTEYSAEALRVSAPGGYEIAVDLNSLTDAALVRQPDYGTCLKGGDGRSCRYGEWHSESWGDYRMIVHPDVPCCILLDDGSGPVAVNGASEDETVQMYDSISARLPGAQESDAK